MREHVIVKGRLRTGRIDLGGDGSRAYVLAGMAAGDPLYELEGPRLLLDECAGGPVLLAGTIMGVVRDLPILRVTRVDRLGTP